MNKSLTEIDLSNPNQSMKKYKFWYRFVGEEFPPTHATTIGIEKTKTTRIINDKEISVFVWDTAGQEKYRSIPPSYYRDSKGILLVYDITDGSKLGSVTWEINVDA